MIDADFDDLLSCPNSFGVQYSLEAIAEHLHGIHSRERLVVFIIPY